MLYLSPNYPKKLRLFVIYNFLTPIPNGKMTPKQILLIKAVCLARLQAREFGVATCVLKIFSKIFFS